MSKKKVHQKQLIRDQGKLNRILAMQRQNDMIAMLLDGKSTDEIVTYISSKYSCKKNSAKTFLHEARQEIKKRQWFEVNNLVSLHIHRYEDIYKGLMEIGAEGYAMNALRAKEKLLGFHREGFHMKVTQGEIQAIQQSVVDSEYDFNKLTSSQRNRLDELLQKAKRDGGDTKIIQRTNKGSREE